MRKTLLQRAEDSRRVYPQSDYTSEQLELARAWLSGDIGIMQVVRAMRYSGHAQAYAWLARAARHLYQDE